MNCPHCASPRTKEQRKITALGYRTFRCSACRRTGFEFTHEALRDWEARFAPLIADQLRAKRRGQAGRSWYVDETYLNGATRTWSLTLSEAKEVYSLVGFRPSPKGLMATGVAFG